MQQRQINVSQLPDIKCSCGSAVFRQVNFLKMVPALLIGAAQNDAMPVPAFQCIKCDKVLDLAQAVQKAAQNMVIDARKT